MHTIGSYLLGNAYSALSPVYNTATALCSVNGQNVPCGDFGAVGAGLAGVFLIFMFVMLAVLILTIIATWKIFTKAGQPGWASIIPIYSTVILLTIVKKPIWWIILFFIPFVNIIISVIVLHELSKAFGKDAAFTVGLVLLPFVFYPILAFGKAQYRAPMDPAVTPTPMGTM